MKAVVFDGQQLRLAVHYAVPQSPPGEVRLRTTLAGICNTDLEVVRGYAGFHGVLGHEFVGVVDQAQTPGLVGRRVVGEINAACGSPGCDTCRLGRPTHCPNRTALGIHGRDGTLAEYFCLPEGNLHLVPEGIPDEAAVFAEPLAAACEVLEQIQVRPTEAVVVVGDGKLGLLVAQVLALTGCDLTAVGRHEDKLAILAARGIRTRLGDEGLERSADVVVECSGRPEGFQTARRLVRPRGTLVLKSTYGRPQSPSMMTGTAPTGLVPTDLSGLVVDEIQMVGSRCGPFPAALRLLAQGLIDVVPLVEAEYPLDEALAAFEHAGRRGALKVLVRAAQ